MYARFVTAASSAAELPSSELAEIAVAGRSNCGKSSLINAVTAHHKLARASSTPGRTRQLVLFAVQFANAPRFHLVDLPGYGFAKVSKAERSSWAPMIERYIERRQQLRGLVLLCDIRRPIQPDEQSLVTWARQRGLWLLLVLTKADKLPKNRRHGAVVAAQRAAGLSVRPHVVSVNDEQSVGRLRADLARRIVNQEPPLSSQSTPAARESGVEVAEDRPFVVGITGGIAAGKSSVARMFAELGAPVVDADLLARNIMQGTVLQAVIDAFGHGVLDDNGALDRRKLATLVFGNDTARRQLETITHPAIAAASTDQFAALHTAGYRPIVYEAALLIEAGRHRDMSKLVVVVADDTVRLQRLMQRDSLDETQARQRIAAQLSQREKAALADYIVDNSFELGQTREQVHQIWQDLALCCRTTTPNA